MVRMSRQSVAHALPSHLSGQFSLHFRLLLKADSACRLPSLSLIGKHELLWCPAFIIMVVHDMCILASHICLLPHARANVGADHDTRRAALQEQLLLDGAEFRAS